MWTIFFYLFVYLRINQAFERIQTRYHVAFYLQIIIWGLTLWASILFQIRNNPIEKNTCGTEVTIILNVWVVTNTVYGLFIGCILFIFSYRYGSEYDMQCLRCIENFNLIHGEERLKFYQALYDVEKTEEFTLQENNLDDQEKTQLIIETVGKRMDENPDLHIDTIIKILKKLEVVTAYSSNVATAKQFYDAGLDLIKPVGDDAKQIRGLKMNRMTTRELEINLGKYFVTEENLIQYKDEEAGKYIRKTQLWFEENKKEFKDTHFVFKLRSGIVEAFMKEWDYEDVSEKVKQKLGEIEKLNVTIVKNGDNDTMKLIDLERWCLRYKWSLHPDNGKKLLLDWREDLAQWEIKHYMGNLVTPRHYVIVDESDGRVPDIFPFEKGAKRLKSRDFDECRDKEIHVGDGVLVKKEKFEGLVEGRDNKKYFDGHHTSLAVTRGTKFVKAYVVSIFRDSGEMVYHLMLELDVLKCLYLENPVKLKEIETTGDDQLIFKESMMEKMDKWPMNEVANMAKRLNADLDQFIEDGYMDFKSLKYTKADQKNLLERQVNNLLQLEPLSAGFKLAHYKDNVEEHRFTVLSVDPCHFTIERGSRTFKTIVTLLPLDMLLGAWAIYVSSKVFQHNCFTIRAVHFVNMVSFFWLTVVMVIISYTIARMLGTRCCGYRTHQGHGFGISYERQAKSYKMSDVMKQRRKRRRSTVLNDLFDLVQRR